MRHIFQVPLYCILFSGLISCQNAEKPLSGNPILPGDYADPCILVHLDTFYIYGTTGSYASVWYSPDFRNWRMRKLNWPTSMGLPNIWAPAVRKGVDGRFYFYTSTDHNIYAGVADHPMGPFENILGDDSIFIQNRQWWEKMHSIDADCFVDDDGQAYLYWGSGFEFIDGICAAGVLGEDMASFKEAPSLVTPEGYFEGPHMMKREGTYYLMYSDGHYYDSTYKVRYATGDNPLGPFKEGRNSPILISSPDGKVSGPGHHYTINLGDDYYIVYHAHGQPFYAPHWGPIRQVFIDKLEFEPDGSIRKVIPSDKGVPLDFVKADIRKPARTPVQVEASSFLGEAFSGMKAFDADYGTLWAADRNDLPVWIMADFGKEMDFTSCELVFDLVDGDYDYLIEYSTDGDSWQKCAAGNNARTNEWPETHAFEVHARYFRVLVLDQSMEPNRAGLWEIRFY